MSPIVYFISVVLKFWT